MKTKHKGFTLVELLIVIVVIGVLAVMMLISAQEFVISSKATKIVNDLTQMKKAATAWYLENHERLKMSNNGYTIDGSNNKNNEIHAYLNAHPEEIQRYFTKNFALNSGAKGQNPKNSGDYSKFFAPVGGFAVYLGNSNTRLYVVYRISDNDKVNEEARLKDKLKGRAKSLGLLSYKQGQEPKVYNGEECVFMFVLRLDNK